MPTKLHIGSLLRSYDAAVGTGNLKQAGKILPKIIHALVEMVEARTPDYVAPENEVVPSIHSKQTCEPCTPPDDGDHAKFGHPLSDLHKHAPAGKEDLIENTEIGTVAESGGAQAVLAEETKREVPTEPVHDEHHHHAEKPKLDEPVADAAVEAATEDHAPAPKTNKSKKPS